MPVVRSGTKVRVDIQSGVASRPSMRHARRVIDLPPFLLGLAFIAVGATRLVHRSA